MTNTCRMLWTERTGDTLYPAEMGLILRPKSIKVERYKAEYDRPPVTYSYHCSPGTFLGSCLFWSSMMVGRRVVDLPDQGLS